MPRSPHPSRRRTGARIVLLATLIALGAGLLVPAVAGAQDAGPPDTEAGAQAPRRPRLTDEQRQCLRDQDLERPARGERPTDAQIQAFRDAADECGIELPERPAA